MLAPLSLAENDKPEPEEEGDGVDKYRVVEAPITMTQALRQRQRDEMVESAQGGGQGRRTGGGL